MRAIIFAIVSLLSVGTYAQNAPNNAIFDGGIGDGWSTAMYSQTANNIFTGGQGDGWAAALYAQPGNNIYNGGVGDGWASSEVWSIELLKKEAFDFGSAFKVYPNPSQRMLYVELGQPYDSTTINIINANGQRVWSKNYGPSQILEVDFESPAGVYFMQINAGQKRASVKLIKQ
ncbi:Por secretion system C-terminal sorting domain-containing protein [Flavobacterium caeni]|uniref:Por secretion system C-terminal sorting domain-containing protein n=2 Tax=Flavobacterium caeni TaxID=490189 RepID=A0A1G5GWT9_9FLAO|nr:Por secretion system C-terminal sorting domain-containing protein [Flavobacterium caeni]